MKQVRRLRQAKRWKQRDLAYHADLATSVISQIENGRRDPSMSTLRKLAQALEVDIPDLFDRIDSPKAQAPLWLDDSSEERGDWRGAYDRLGRQLFDRWESQLEARRAMASDNLAAFVVWVGEITNTLNAYTAEVLHLNPEEWPALANELDPEIGPRERRFFHNIQETLEKIGPRAGSTDFEEQLEKLRKEIARREAGSITER